MKAVAEVWVWGSADAALGEEGRARILARNV